MNASHDWLRQFVAHDRTPEQVRDLLTARCATVEEMERLRADLAGVVVGRVVEAGRHPDSDRLTLTRVDAGGELLEVVCGAPNVEVGAVYPFAPVGTVLPGGLKLDRRKIRGIYSNGMLCSARELGLGEEHDGIMRLDTDAAPGTPFLEAFPAGDVRLVVDVLPNRPDLLSQLGVAREIAAAVGAPLRRPDELGQAPALEWTRGDAEAAAAGVTVRIAPDARTARYAAVVVRGVRVGPSPQWLVDRLAAVGARSINNVVDVTNYMLHGFGQPMHAFDLARLAQATIVVRPAAAGETLVTLDGAERTLQAGMTVIADAERAQAVAGVMGGRDSEVGEGTTDVLLEIASFDPRQIRATRRALGLSTDASYRFERGIDPHLPVESAADAAGLLVAVAGGRVEAAILVEPQAPVTAPALTLRTSRVARLVGVELSTERIAELLSSVGFACTPADEGLHVAVPGWRLDVAREVDLVEEVARLHGYDALPDDVRPFRPGTVPDAPLVAVSRRVRDALVREGLLEARPLPFVAGAEGEHARVLNPIAENEAHLRRSVLETLARRAEYNLTQSQGNVRLFEVGTVFAPTGGALPDETMNVGVLMMGDRRPPHFTEPRPPRVDEWDAKGVAERLAAEVFRGQPVSLEPAAVEGEPSVLWRIMVDGAEQGRVVRVALDAPVWAAPAYGIELSLGDVRAAAAPGRRGAAPYRALPTTPAAEFDLALLVPEGVTAAQLDAVIREDAGELLERLSLFDEYRGAGVPAGHRSLAWRLTFRHPERTLRDKEIEGRRAKLLRTLEQRLGVTPRG